jgi:hypothetical protein
MMQTQAWKKGARVDMNIDLIRHIVLNGVLQVVKNHRRQYGTVIIACDQGTSWRKLAFEYYKGARKATRDAFKLDWVTFFKFLDELISELKESFPYIVLNIPHAEGDDVIGTIVRWYQENQVFEEILIVSGDKDFKQLHNERTRQFSPILRKFIGTTDPALELKEHIIKGDRGDGVPNILSADGCLVLGDRQTKMSAKRLKKYMELDPSEYEPTVQRNWARNKMLIDLASTPQRLQDQILEQFKHQQDNPNKNRVFDYLFKYSLKELQASAGDF